MIPTQHEIVTPSPLLDAQGRLTQIGWARAPLLDCNLEAAHFYPRALRFLQPLRILQQRDATHIRVRTYHAG